MKYKLDQPKECPMRYKQQQKDNSANTQGAKQTTQANEHRRLLFTLVQCIREEVSQQGWVEHGWDDCLMQLDEDLAVQVVRYLQLED
jgi:hypothetical protein